MSVAGPRRSWAKRSAGDRVRFAIFAAAVLLIAGGSVLANRALQALIDTGDALDRAQTIQPATHGPSRSSGSLCHRGTGQANAATLEPLLAPRPDAGGEPGQRVRAAAGMADRLDRGRY